MKKQKVESGEGEEAPKARKELSAGEKQELLSKLEQVDNWLMELDNECAKEQMAIQRQFDEKKKPIFDERRSIIEKIPKFWAETISKHPVFQENMHQEDLEVLEFLKDIELEDNLDDEGSYKIKLVFDEAVSDIMEPNVLVKHVVFKDNEEVVNEVTRIKWMKESPRDAIEKKLAETDDSKEFRRSIISFFDLFSEDTLGESIDIGEVIRRDIYHAPLLYYCEEESDLGE